jgi:hypothetical protein
MDLRTIIKSFSGWGSVVRLPLAYCLICGVIVAAVMGFIGCEKRANYNPFDPNNPDYQKPEVKYISIIDSSVFTTDTLPITWKGNFPEYCEYRYRYCDTIWSDWTKDTLTTEILADGDYLLQVSARYTDFTDTTITAVHFRIKTLPDSALYLYPRSVSITKDNPHAKFLVMGKNLDSCNALRFKIPGLQIDSAKLIGFTSPCFFNGDSMNFIITDKTNTHISGTKAFLSLWLGATGQKDTTLVDIVSIQARNVRIDTQDSVVIKKIKGGFLKRKNPLTAGRGN